MLAELSIRNYALIDELGIEFQPGFNVITGETGAGKSIIIHALTMVLGARGNRDMIKTGQDRLVVQAEFFGMENSAPLQSVLESLGMEQEESLILYRELHANGRNVCRVNGVMVTVSDLKRVGDQLVDIHSQRDHNLILNREEHIEILDYFGGDLIAEKKAETKKGYERWNETLQKKQDMLRAVQQDQREMELYRFQLGELEAVDFEIGEDEELEERIKVLSHREALFKNASQVYEVLYGGEKAALGQLFEAKKDLEEMERYDTSLESARSRVESLMIELEDISFSMRSYKEEIIFDDAELNQAQSKLNKLVGLKRKYGADLEEVLQYKKDLVEKIHRVEDRDHLLEELEWELEEAKEKYLACARSLHDAREEVSHTFCEEINAQLHELAMSQSDMKVQLNWSEEESSFSPNGLDQVEFFIRTNKGEDHKPLVRIASGGEVSRIMLAIKTTMGLSMGRKCLVFDEVDTGISGKAAASVGNKLKELSEKAQVIAITHLPQIASLAEIHFEVSKDVEGERTTTAFTKLGKDGRIRALSVMMDGGDTQAGRELSKKLLERHNSL